MGAVTISAIIVFLLVAWLAHYIATHYGPLASA